MQSSRVALVCRNNVHNIWAILIKTTERLVKALPAELSCPIAREQSVTGSSSPTRDSYLS